MAIDRIVHLGAQAGVRYSIENPHAYVQSNLAGHLNLLELARHRQVEHMVYASSSSVYGGNTKLPFAVEDRVDHPVSLYAATKRADELMSETYAHSVPPAADGPAVLHRLWPVGPARHDDVDLHPADPGGRADPGVQPRRYVPRFHLYRRYHRRRGRLPRSIRRPMTARKRPGGSIKPHRLYNIGNNRCEHLMKVIDILEEACGKKAEIELLPMQPGDVHQTYADISAISARSGLCADHQHRCGCPQLCALVSGVSRGLSP